MNIQEKIPLNSTTNPYPGLRPYHEDEQRKFFGRDTDAEVLIDKLLSNRLTLLFAASGVGKSSLLQAAVIPRLKSPSGENLSVVYHIDWVSDPISSVRMAILQALRISGKLPEEMEYETGQTLAELLEFCGLFIRYPLILILDQFEEFFRYQRATASFQLFIEQLTAVIINPQLPVSVVISMREDFAMELNALKSSLPTFLFGNFFRLEKINKTKAQEAIELPIKALGHTYEKKLLNTLLNDLSNQYLVSKPSVNDNLFSDTIELPYLQIVCSYLWKTKNPNKKTISYKDYLEAGGAQHILQNHLNISLAKLTHPEKYFADRILSCLISYPGFKVAYTIEGLSEAINVKHNELLNILNKLEQTHIIRKNNNKDDNWYELSHDMYSQIIREWQYSWRNTFEWDISSSQPRKITHIKYNKSKLELLKQTMKNRMHLLLVCTHEFFKKKPNKKYTQLYKNHSTSGHIKLKPSYAIFMKKHLIRLFSEEHGVYIFLWLMITSMYAAIIWIVITQNY